MTYIDVSKVRFDEGFSVDPFSRARMSSALSIFNGNFEYDLAPRQWDTITTGTASAVYLSSQSAVTMNTGTAINDKVIRQTRQYFRDQLGKSITALIGTIFGVAKTNVVRCAGMYDTYDGVFLKQTNANISIVKRTSVSGSIIETEILQEDWNIDNLDGTGKSKTELDLSKANVLIIETQNIRVGKIRVGFCINESIIYCHEFNHTNIINTTKFSSAVLPIRFEQYNTGTATSSSMIQICSAVISEGGASLSELIGPIFSASNGSTFRTCPSSSYLPILAIRLKTSFKSKDFRGIIVPTNIDVYSADRAVEGRLILNPTLTGGTWLTADTDSAVDYNITATSFSGGDYVLGFYVSSKDDIKIPKVFDRLPLTISADGTTSDILAVTLRGLSGTASACTSLQWKEIY